MPFTFPSISVIGEYDCSHMGGSCTPATKEIFNYGTNAILSSDFVSVNSGKFSSGNIVVTDGAGQRGAVWLTQKQYVKDSWTVEFSFRVRKTGSVGNADGFAFVMQGQGTGAQGSKGSWGQGYVGIQRSFGVLFDVYMNNEIGLFINGQTQDCLVTPCTGGKLAGATLSGSVDIDNEQWHVAQITYEG